MKFLMSLLGVLSPVHIIWVTMTSGARRIGIDGAGNKYYEAKPRSGYNYPRRWVMYKGAPEASKVPPEWHGWLHHQTNVIPSEEGESYRQPWQKPHKPNMIGAGQSHRPANESARTASGDYEAWTPSE